MDPVQDLDQHEEVGVAGAVPPSRLQLTADMPVLRSADMPAKYRGPCCADEKVHGDGKPVTAIH